MTDVQWKRSEWACIWALQRHGHFIWYRIPLTKGTFCIYNMTNEWCCKTKICIGSISDNSIWLITHKTHAKLSLFCTYFIWIVLRSIYFLYITNFAEHHLFIQLTSDYMFVPAFHFIDFRIVVNLAFVRSLRRTIMRLKPESANLVSQMKLYAIYGYKNLLKMNSFNFNT